MSPGDRRLTRRRKGYPCSSYAGVARPAHFRAPSSAPLQFSRLQAPRTPRAPAKHFILTGSSSDPTLETNSRAVAAAQTALRAFETTGKLKAPWFMYAAHFGLQQLRSSELESFMAWAVRKLGPLLALGEPGEHLGAGRIKTTSENWQEAVRQLVDKSLGILIIPSDRPGTLWEIQFLKSNDLLAKTVFIMPPEARGFDWRARWHKARKALGEFGSALPEYDRHGLMFRLDADGRVINAHHFPIWRPGKFRKAVKRFLSCKAKTGDPTKLVPRAIRGGRRHWFFGALYGLFVATLLVWLTYHAVTTEPVLSPSEVTEPWATLWDRFIAASEIDRQEQSMVLQLSLDTGYQQLVENLSGAEEAELRGTLLWRGLPWISPEKMQTFFSALAQAYSGLSRSRCSALINGEMASSDLNYLFVRIDPDLLRDLGEAKRAAIKAGIDHPNPPAIPDTKLSEAAKAFLSSLSPEDRARYTEPPASLSDEEQCWRMVTTYRGFMLLDEDLLPAYFSILDRDDLSIINAASMTSAPSVASDALTPDQRLLASPAYQQRMAGLEKDAAVEVLVDLMNAGLVRLDDESAVAHITVTGEVVSRLHLDECVEVAQGRLSADGTSVFAHLPESIRKIWSDGLSNAALLELEERPIPPLEDDALNAAVDSLFATFAPEEVTRVNRLGDDPDSVTPEDVCWFLQKKMLGIRALEPPHRVVWARALLMGKF